MHPEEGARYLFFPIMWSNMTTSILFSVTTRVFYANILKKGTDR
jgi:hypothetical protein